MSSPVSVSVHHLTPTQVVANVDLLSLAVLSLGTFPPFFAFGPMIGSLNAGRPRHLHRILGVTFVCFGYILAPHGLALLGVVVPHIELPYYEPPTPP